LYLPEFEQYCIWLNWEYWMSLKMEKCSNRKIFLIFIHKYLTIIMTIGFGCRRWLWITHYFIKFLMIA
jgi:hypothetical protein